MLLEHFFSNEVEVNYDEVYHILTDINKSKITEEERVLIITTVVTMYFRTAIWKNKINGLHNAVFERAYSLCKQQNKDYFYYRDIKISIKGKSLEDLQNEYKIKENVPFLLAQLNAMAVLFDMRFQNDDICVISIDDESEFISSDNPVMVLGKGQIVIPVSPENVMFLPIDNKHILWLLPNDNINGRLTVFRRKIIHPGEVDEYNSMQKQFCERFLFGSKSSLLQIRN
jgi:hypothetical protein